MGLFSNILEKLGIKKAATPAIPVGTSPSAGAGTLGGAVGTAPVAPNTPVTSAGVARPAGIPVVDVVSKLEAMAKANPQKLDWKVSIVDLLKLLGLDSSLDARKGLAAELGCPANLIGGDYSQMNVWLQKTVLQKIAENGGNIPASLLK
jgi:hypothetical protein